MDRQKEQKNLEERLIGMMSGKIEQFRHELTDEMTREINKHFVILKEKDKIEEEES